MSVFTSLNLFSYILLSSSMASQVITGILDVVEITSFRRGYHTYGPSGPVLTLLPVTSAKLLLISLLKAVRLNQI